MRKMLIFLISLLISSPSMAQPLASVNGTELTKEQLMLILQSIPANQRQALTILPNPKEEIVNKLIGEELLYQEALKNKAEQDEDYKARLEQAKKALLTQYHIQKISLKAITPDKVRGFYDKNKLKYHSSTINVSRLVVPEKKRAEEIISKMSAGKSFPELAQEEAKKPNVSFQPRINVTRRMLPDDLGKMIFAGNPRQVVGPRKLVTGYELYFIHDKTEGVQVPFDEVREIAAYDFQQEFLKEKIASLKKKAKVKIDKKQLGQVAFP